MSKRLTDHKIDTTFIEAIDPTSPVLSWFEKGNTRPRISTQLEHCCFLSHLKAIREFVYNSGEAVAVIMEDDGLLHKDYASLLQEVVSQRGGYNLIMLTHWVNSWQGVRKTPIDGWYTIAPFVYSAYAYLITREYAIQCLHLLDRPLWAIQENRVVSELITRLSGGVFINKPLVISLEDGSTVRPGEKAGNERVTYYKPHGIEDYS